MKKTGNLFASDQTSINSMSSNIATRRVPVRTRSTTVKASENATINGVATRSSRLVGYKDSIDVAADAGPSKPVAATAKTVASAAGVLGTRKRAALGDLTNANRTRTAATTSATSKDDLGKGKAALKEPLKTRTAASTAASSRTTTGASRRIVSTKTEAAVVQETRPVRAFNRVSSATSTASANATAARATSTRTAGAVSRTKYETSRPKSTASTTATRREKVSSKDHFGLNQVQELQDTVDLRESKRIKTDRAAIATKPAKDEGWEDLDAEDYEDPLMVAEYVNDIFEYMKEIEIVYMPNAEYMSMQKDINWNVRAILIDWLIDVHAKFRLLPETLFLTVNIIDRFLSRRMITLTKLQLVGVTAMFVAAKYEEVLCPSIKNFIYLADGGYTDKEILQAERYMFRVLNFNLSYANPMNFLRRISKADNYDIQTRTVAKYFMEISLVDYRLMEHPPSLIAAASVWLAREVLERGEWTPTLVHYSTYSEEELLGTAEIMLDYCLRPLSHPYFHKKYAAKKFMRASTYVIDWARNTFPDAIVADEELQSQDLTQLRVNLFEQRGLERPVFTPLSSSRDTTPLSDTGIDYPNQLKHANDQDLSDPYDDDRAVLRDMTNEYDSSTY